MAIAPHCASLCLALVSTVLLAQSPASLDSPYGQLQALPSGAQQLFALANQSRAAASLPPLQWDQSLASAALQHCLRMAREGPIAHRYGDEPDLTLRAAQAGAHFSLIEENIAVGPYPASIHQGWMRSPDHRANLLNPAVDRVGIAVVQRGGALFAVADYAHAEPVLTRGQVEAVFAAMLRARGLAILTGSPAALDYCASTGRFTAPDPPDFAIRWQGPDLTRLPADLDKKLASGRYRQAAVASCPAEDVEGAFTVYRVAVLLYGADAVAFQPLPR
jgi:hypothetical protein